MNGPSILTLAILVKMSVALELNLTLKNLRVNRHLSVSPFRQLPQTKTLPHFALKNSHLQRFLGAGFSGSFASFESRQCAFHLFKGPVLAQADSEQHVTDQVLREWDSSSVPSNITFERCTFTEMESSIVLAANTKASFLFCTFTDLRHLRAQNSVFAISGQSTLSLRIVDMSSNYQGVEQAPVFNSLPINMFEMRGSNVTRSNIRWSWLADSSVIDDVVMASQSYQGAPITATSPSMTVSHMIIKDITITQTWSVSGMSDLCEFSLSVSSVSSVSFDRVCIGQNQYQGDALPYHILTMGGTGSITNCCFSLPEKQWVYSPSAFTLKDNEQNGDCCDENSAKMLKLKVIADIEFSIGVGRKYQKYFDW